MQVACTSCPAKYAVPDEKVRGKRARITCKHCGAAIIIDGTGLDSSPQSPRVGGEPSNGRASARPPAPVRPEAPRESPASSAGGRSGPWVVALGEGRQESVSIPRVVELFASGTIGENTYLWREGMSDWKKPFEIPQIEAALRARSFFPNSPPAPPDDEATLIVPPPSEVRSNNGSFPGYPEEESVTLTLDPTRTREALADRGNTPESGLDAPPNAVRPRAVTKLGIGGALQDQTPPTLRASTPPPPTRNGAHPGARPLPELHHRGLSASPGAHAARAARRPYARTSGSVDLFAERASSYAPPPDPSESDPPWTDPTLAPRMTGARNESSVLFSLDALKAEHEPERRRPGTNTNEPLYSSVPPPPPPPPPPFLSQPPPAAFSAALSAPDFTAPAPRYEPQAPPPPRHASVPARSAQTVPPQGSPFAQRPNGPFPPHSRAPERGVSFTPPGQPGVPRRDFSYAAVANDDFEFRPPRRRGRYLLIALLVVGAVAGGVFALGLGTTEEKSVFTVATPVPSPTPPPVATTPPAPLPPAVESAEPAPTLPATAAPLAAAPAWRAQRSPTPPRAFTATRERGAAEEDEPVRLEETPEPRRSGAAPRAEATAPEAKQPPSLADAIAASEGKAPTSEPPGSSEPGTSASEETTAGSPFDKGAALSVLTSAADNAQSCKKLGGPTGSGQATVTFAPSGRVTMANVGGDFAGSSVGSCVAKLFRNARVPAFSGSPVTVTKRFSIE